MSVVPLVLGIDIGTTETKAVATTLDGELRGIGAGPTTWQSRSDGGAETAPTTLLDAALHACAGAVTAALGELPTTPVVAGIGITSIAESGVLLRPDGSPSDAPVIAWHDPRGGEEFRALDQEFLRAFTAQTGLRVSPLPTFAKLLWLREHRGLELAGRCWLNVAEFVVHAWGGAPGTEASLASRTGLLDQDDLTPFGAALERLGATSGLVPELVSAGARLGQADERVPVWLRGAWLTVAGHDHPVASVASGATGPTDLFDSCGTAEALLRVTDHRISPDQRLELSQDNVSQGAHLLPGRRLLLGGTRGGQLLKRTLAMLGAAEGSARDALDAACPTGPVDLPVHVDGGRLDAQEVWLRLDRDDVSPPLVWRAALEAAADQAQLLVDRFEAVVGPAGRMVAAGGWTRSASYRAVKRARFPGVIFSDIEQSGGLGAAAVAAFAADGQAPKEQLPAAIERFMAGYAGSGAGS